MKKLYCHCTSKSMDKKNTKNSIKNSAWLPSHFVSFDHILILWYAGNKVIVFFTHTHTHPHTHTPTHTHAGRCGRILQGYTNTQPRRTQNKTPAQARGGMRREWGAASSFLLPTSLGHLPPPLPSLLLLVLLPLPLPPSFPSVLPPPWPVEGRNLHENNDNNNDNNNNSNS